MNSNPKYKIGETIYLRLGANLEDARSKYLGLFPKFLKHRLYAGYTDQIVLRMKPMKIVGCSYFLDLEEYYYELQVEVDGETFTIRKLESFLCPLIESRVVPITEPDYPISYCEEKILKGDHLERIKFAKLLDNPLYEPSTTEIAVNYYIALSKFEKLLKYGPASIMPLWEYLVICSDTEKIPYIFYTFKHLSGQTEIPLLHLLTIPEYEHRQYVYDILSDIGTENCIEYFEAMKQQDNKYQDRISEGLEKLKRRHNV